MAARVRNFIRKLNRVGRALKIVKTAALEASTDPAEQANIQAYTAFVETGDGDFVLGNRVTRWTHIVPADLVRAVAAQGPNAS